MPSPSANLHRRHDPDWNDLRFFLAVARAGSTLAAARELGVNQSTVARRVAALQDQLGCLLFERRDGRYRLTDLGSELLPLAERVDDAVAALGRRLSTRDAALSGTVTVTCAEGLGYRLVTPLIDAFHARHPRIAVSLVIADRYRGLGKGEADVAVRAGAPGDDGLVGRKIADNPWAVFASASYMERHGRPATPDDLGKHRVIGFEGAIADLHAARWLRDVAPDATVVARCNSVVGLLMTAKSGIGLALMPVHLGDLEDGLVRVVDPVPALNSLIYLMTHPDLKSTPRVRAFIDFVVGEMPRLRPMLLGLPAAAEAG